METGSSNYGNNYAKSNAPATKISEPLYWSKQNSIERNAINGKKCKKFPQIYYVYKAYVWKM